MSFNPTNVASTANIASLRLNVSTSTSNVWVMGYYSLSDGGEGMFTLNASDTTSSDNGGTIIVDAGGNRWYRDLQGNPVTVKQFGAKGDGTTDDTTSIQAAINYVKALTTYASEIVFPTPSTGYLVTSPLNCTTSGSGTNEGLTLRGASERASLIIGNLASGGPIIDMTGIRTARIIDLGITNTTSGSLATCGLLIASNAATTTNYNGLMERCFISLTNNDVIAGLCIQNGDLFCIDHSYVVANNASGTAIGISCGVVAASGITSPFQTINSSGDQTDYRINNSWVNGNLGVDFTGGGGFSFTNTYVAVVGTINGDDAIIRFNASGSSDNIVFKAINLRTENQASASTCYAFYSKGTTPLFRMDVYGSELNINPTTTGAFVKIDNGVSYPELNLNFFAASGSFPLVNIAAGALGKVTGSSNVSANPVFGAGVTVAEWLHTNFYNANNLSVLNPVLLGPGTTGTNIGGGAPQQCNLLIDARIKYQLGVAAYAASINGYNYGLWWSGNGTYTGGSGTQIIETFTIPAGMLVGETAVGTITRKLQAQIHGITSQPNCTVGIQLRQSASTYSLGTFTVPSASQVEMALVVDNRTSAKGVYFSGRVDVGLAIALNNLTTAAYGNIDPTADFYLDITVSCSANSPFTTATHSIVVT